MRTTFLLSVAADLSEEGLRIAWKELHEPDPEACILYVGTQQAAASRTARKGLGKHIGVYVRPDWSTEWMLCTRYKGIFSEGA